MEVQVCGLRPWSDGSETYVPDPHVNLAIAVIRSAVEDYIDILVSIIEEKSGKNNPEQLLAKKSYMEKFFYSPMYEFYSAFMSIDLSPDEIVRNCSFRAEEKYRERIRRRQERLKEPEKQENNSMTLCKPRIKRKSVKKIKNGLSETLPSEKSGKARHENAER